MLTLLGGKQRFCDGVSRYHKLGIDPHSAIRDALDRPAHILPTDAQTVRELCA